MQACTTAHLHPASMCDSPSCTWVHWTCLVGLQTSISSTSAYLRRYLRIDLTELCDRYSWAHVLLNLFDGGDLHQAGALPPCVRVTRYPRFKSFFWFMAISPEVAVRYSHIFLVDSDMALRPSRFALPMMMRLQEAVNASVMHPAIRGSNANHRLDNARCLGSRVCDCDDQGPRPRGVAMCDMTKPEGCNPHTKCTVCRQIMVEVKAPLFTSIAWQAVHIVILQSINATRIGQQNAAQLWSGIFLLDALWCGVVNHFVHGTMPVDSRTRREWRTRWTQGARTRESVGLACAVSYATPIHDLDHRSIRRFSTSGSVELGRRAAVELGRKAASQVLILPDGQLNRTVTLSAYAVHPSWRPARTALSRKPCWNASELARALDSRGLTEPFRLSALPPFSPGSRVPEWDNTAMQCRMPRYSADHSSRNPMWCGGSHGSMLGPWSRQGGPSVEWRQREEVATDAAWNGTCMLTPVWSPHFNHLENRLLQTARFAVGEVPTTVVVFDDAAAHAAFCARHPAGCNPDVKLYPLNLKALLGDEKYAVARSMLASGNWRRRELRRNRTFGSDPLASACSPKFGGQCYQSLKKFYGAAQGPCSRYWVSDAETFPFRMYSWSQLVQVAWPSTRRPFLLVPSWYPDRWGCTYTQDSYSDSSCGVWTASRLKLTSFPDFTVSETDVQKKMWQTRFDINNWWLYDRRTARAMIDRTEQTAAMHFVDFFAPMMMTNIPFWRYHVEHLSQQIGSPLITVNYFELLQTAFPVAYAACCKCRSDHTQRPCYELTDLWSPCFRRHASDVALARFVVNDLGIFSVFGNEANQMPEGVLQADSRLAWVHNNAYRWSAHQKLRRSYAPAAERSPQAQRAAPGCPRIIAIISAQLGTNRDRAGPAQAEPCARYFLFSNSTHDATPNWTLVLPAKTTDTVSITGDIIYSRSWNTLLGRIARGLHDPRLRHAPYGNETRAELPFDPGSLGHTQPRLARQNLAGMIASKYVKVQMLHIDVLQSFDFLAWADAGLVLGPGLGTRLLRGFDDAVDVQVLAHPFRRPASLSKEMAQGQLEQARIAELGPYIDTQRQAYLRAGFPIDHNETLHWLCFFALRRTVQSGGVMDMWWLEIRRWQYRDQMSWPFVLWQYGHQHEVLRLRMMTDFLDAQAGSPQQRLLCKLLLGSEQNWRTTCCRRCRKRHKPGRKKDN